MSTHPNHTRRPRIIPRTVDTDLDELAEDYAFCRTHWLPRHCDERTALRVIRAFNVCKHEPTADNRARLTAIVDAIRREAAHV